MPGRNGIPLNYVIRESEERMPGEHPDCMDGYVSMVKLDGPAFSEDANVVQHTLLASLIAGNETAEAKVQSFVDKRNGRKDFLALKEH